MNTKYEQEILEMTSLDSRKLLDKKVKIYLTRKDFEKQEYIGIIREINITNKPPYKPFEILIEIENGEKIPFGIVGINKIEFLK